MVTGKRAFVATSPASLIGAILKDEPKPIREMKPLTPPSLDRLVKTCLAKDPDERWQSAHDLAAELRWITDEVSPATTTAGPPSRWGSFTRLAPWFLTVATMLAAAWAVRTRSGPDATALQVQQLEVTFPADIEPIPAFADAFAISPDGRIVAMAGYRNRTRGVFVRRLESTEVLEIPEPSASIVTFAPDGTSVAIAGASGITSFSLVDQQRTVVTPAGDSIGGLAWGEAGIAFTRSGALWLAPTGGGAPRPLTTLDAVRGEVMHTAPVFLPGGRGLLFSSLTTEPG